MADLKNGSTESHLRTEKRPDKIRVEKREPARGEGTAQGRDGKRRRDRGSPENDQEEGKKEKARCHGGTARTGNQTEKEPGEEGQGKKQDGAQIPERMIHAGDIATPVPSRPGVEAPRQEKVSDRP